MLDTRTRKRALRDMLFSRRFEEQCFQSYQVRKIGGFLHLYPGQEACAHGVMLAARPGRDYVITGYRDHVHALCAGVDPKAVMAELFGRATGCSKGFGGSMHLFDLEKRFMGGYALVGGPFPLAAGMALALKRQKRDDIAICFLGDAANNQGTFHETLNMASVWKLPVLFVCENNLYGIGTAIERSTAVLDQWKRVAAYDIEAAWADGQDLDAVHSAATVAVDHVRKQGRPYFLELKTYRFRGHSMSDGQGYRSKAEVEEWQQRDPLEIALRKLEAEGAMTRDQFAAMDKDVLAEVSECVAFADASPPPDVGDLHRYTFVEGDPWVRGGQR
jgi:pyruvate dehydrogenase E1 component alpha subunit